MASAKLLSKVGIVSGMTGISRVFGLVREIIMASFFGTSTLQSAFVIAFRIPNLFRRLFGEGALGAAFIPVFVEIERTEGRARAQLFMGRLLGLMVCALGLLLALGILASYGVEWTCGAGSRWSEAMPLLRIMFPYALLICLAAIVSAVLNVHDRFAISSLTPVILNLVWLVALIGICPFLPATGYWRIGTVAWGIVVGGVIQVLFQLPELKKVGYLFRLKFTGWRTSPYIRQVLLQMGPAALGIALAQINICMDGWLAFYGATWAPSALEYADRIIYLPLGLFGTAFATVLLPTYSRQYAEGDIAALRETMTRALRTLTLIMVPMAIGVMILAMPTVALIYERGAFTADSTLYTARAVMAYAPGLIIFSLNKAIVPVFYARKDLRTPVMVASWCIAGNFTMNLLSVLILPEAWRHAGIAASTVINSLMNTIILLILLHKQQLAPTLKPLLKIFGKALMAGLVMGTVIYVCNRFVPLHGLFRLPLCGVLGMGVYGAMMFGLDRTTMREALCELHRRKRNVKSVK